MNAIGINPAQLNSSLPLKATKETQGAGFGDILQESIAAVNQKAQEASALSEGLVTGQHSNIHETMIAMEESSISFRMLAKVQNKVIDAYREVMRLQL